MSRNIYSYQVVLEIYKTARFPFKPIVCWIMTIDTSVFQWWDADTYPLHTLVLSVFYCKLHIWFITVLKYRPLRPSYAHYVTPCSSLYATYNQTSAYTTRGDRTFLVNGGGTCMYYLTKSWRENCNRTNASVFIISI